jgi:CheY-like chemotaxis protein
MDDKPLVVSVDDDPAISRVVQLKLEMSGFRVERFLTAEQALERIPDLRPNVIVTDVRMPGMGGIELCRACERFYDQWDFLTIVLTSQLDEGDRGYVESSPRRRFLQKPFSPRRIVEVIREYLEQMALQPA